MPVRFAVVACAGIAALSLLGPDQPTYDPWAWLLWGREIAHGDLVTVAGPSWKPLPVFFTTPFSLAGDSAPQLWLVVARTGFLLGLVAAWRLASSVAGWAAGALAAAGIVLIDRFLALSLRGDSEGILMGCALGAVALDREGRRRDAVLAGLVACLVRPEVWPFVAAYALWLLIRHVPPQRRPQVLAALAIGALVVLATWFVPEKVGSGSFLRGASRAREPVPDSPAQAAFPFLAVFTNSAGSVTIGLYAGGVLAVGLAAQAWRARARTRDTDLVLVLAAAATAYMVIVGVLAQSGFTGNQRYVLLPAAVVCVLGGIGLLRGAQLVGRHARWAVALGALGVIALAISPADKVRGQLVRAHNESSLYDGLARAVDRAGGAAAVKRCGGVFTDQFQTQPLMWPLHLTGAAVRLRATAPGTIIAPRGTAIAHDTRFPLRAISGGWTIRSTCRLNPT